MPAEAPRNQTFSFPPTLTDTPYARELFLALCEGMVPFINFLAKLAVEQEALAKAVAELQHQQDEWVSLVTASKRLNVSSRTLHNKRVRGDSLLVFQQGLNGRWLVLASSIVAFNDARARTGRKKRVGADNITQP